MKSNNQSITKFSRLAGKQDDVILRRIQKHIIKKHGWKTYIEYYLLFDAVTDEYKGFHSSFSVMQLKGMNVRHPDLFIPEMKLVIEVDGSIHEKNISKTERRDEMYKNGGIHCIVLDLEEIKFLGKNIYRVLETEIYNYNTALMGSMGVDK